jgi:hypothetical protein
MTSPPVLYTIDADTPPGQCPLDPWRRALRYLRIPDHRSGGRTVTGATIKAVLREMCEYADYDTGQGIYPSIAAIALGAQVDYRTAQAAVAAAVAYRLIEVTADRRGHNTPNEYRLLNPAESDLAMLRPDEWAPAVEELRTRAKGTRKPRQAGPERAPAPADPAPVQVPPAVKSEGHPAPGWGAPSTGSGGHSAPRPNQVPTPLPNQDQRRVGYATHDRAREQPEHPEHPDVDLTLAGVTPPAHALTSDQIRARALGRRRRTPTGAAP